MAAKARRDEGAIFSGVLECWSVGHFPLLPLLHHSILPLRVFVSSWQNLWKITEY